MKLLKSLYWPAMALMLAFAAACLISIYRMPAEAPGFHQSLGYCDCGDDAEAEAIVQQEIDAALDRQELNQAEQ